MSVPDSILSFIEQKGPVLPAQVAKHLGQSLLMTSVHMAELSSSGKLKVSSLKVGGSPLYYLEGQESQLDGFSDNLNEKEQRSYNLLKKNQVLRDSDLEPLHRVALRNIKDFATALTVTYNSSQEIFWKFHTTPNEDAERLIRELLGGPKPPKDIQEETQPPKPGEAIPSAQQEQPKQEEQPPQPSEQPKREAASSQEKQTEERPIQEQPQSERSEEEAAQEEQNANQGSKRPKQETQERTQTGPAPKREEKLQGDDFKDQLHSFFQKHKIEIVEETRVRKNADYEFTIAVPSPLGSTEHYCRAKNKKRVTDADLSTALVQGQLKKLPVVLLTTGELTKKAQEMLDSGMKGITVKQLE